MDGSVAQIAFYVLGGCALGGVIGWFLQVALTKRRAEQLSSEVRQALIDVTAQRDKFAKGYSKSRATIESLQAANGRLRAKLKSLSGKSKILAKNVLTLRTERENTKVKVSAIQGALASLRQKSSALQSEFDKTREFYKRELAKSFDKRKALERDIEQARAEQESIAKLVESSIQDHGSPERMLAEAHLRLGQLDVLERNVNKLEAENAQLRRDAVQMKQQLDTQERELAKLDELKVHNQQLVSCVEALEDSRQSHESDAARFRQQAEESEKESDTLRLKLDDLEKNFADIEKQQHEALEDVRSAAVVPLASKQR